MRYVRVVVDFPTLQKGDSLVQIQANVKDFMTPNHVKILAFRLFLNLVMCIMNIVLTSQWERPFE